MSADNYGRYYWCIKVTEEISPTGEIYVFADEATVQDSGCLCFYRDKDGKMQVNLVIAKGGWTTFFAASCIDGHAVAVEHWEGEVCR